MSVAKVKLTPNQSADEAIVALLSNKVQAAPVLDENKLVGIVTSYDFLQREAFEGAVVPVDPTQGSSNVESYAAAARKICGRKVSDVMTASPETVKRDARMRDVAAKMARDRLHTIPVVDDDGGLLGMITSDDVMRDVLNVVKELPEGRNDVLPDMRP
jgi:CBS domain-containing protein